MSVFNGLVHHGCPLFEIHTDFARTLVLIQLILQPQIIRYHRDKLAIGGLTAIVLDCVTKIRIQRIHVASVPCDLDGVADGTLHAGGCGSVLFGDSWVEHLGDGIDDI